MVSVVLLADEGVCDVEEGAEEEENDGGPCETESVRTDLCITAFVFELVAGFGEDGPAKS